MTRKAAVLSDITIRKAAPREKPYKIADGLGLFVQIQPSGGKWWRLKYRFRGKEKLLALGTYPQVSLSEARTKRDEARKLLADGIDPSAHRQIQKRANRALADNSFEVIAREWYAKQAPGWADSHASRTLSRFERDIFPRIGHRPITEITAPELLMAVRPIEHRGALETAHRALWSCGQVFRYAVATGRAERDPSGDLRGALPPVKGTHFPAVTDPARVGELLRMIDGYTGTLTVCCALKLAPLVFVRPGELRKAHWADINLDEALWTYRVTKTGTDHVVPLSTQAVAILRELEPLTSLGPYVFPSARTRERPMSDNAVLAAMRRLGIPKDEMTGHGFRAMARTILDERLRFRPELIEHQLAHAVRDPLGRAYNRTAYLDERRAMMQAWADYLDSLKSGNNVVAIGSAQGGN
ncbi:MAG: integrase arm-type DNA-binding domain-containing protein [Chromatiaceae bacterium]|nr:integrase arm-type DNA-binding domain-containing protein [Chromatiaceae bacterium]